MLVSTDEKLRSVESGDASSVSANTSHQRMLRPQGQAERHVGGQARWGTGAGAVACNCGVRGCVLHHAPLHDTTRAANLLVSAFGGARTARDEEDLEPRCDGGAVA